MLSKAVVIIWCNCNTMHLEPIQPKNNYLTDIKNKLILELVGLTQMTPKTLHIN